MDLYAIPPLVLQTLVWLPTRITLKLLYKLEVKGLENISHIKKNVIFASNHTSELDPILIPASLPFFSKLMPIFYTCREKSFYKNKKFGWKRHIYGGKFFTMWGAYPVGVGMNDYRLALKNQIDILKEDHSVAIFPEGKKNVENSTFEAKGGVAYLANATNSPIIPVRIDGAIKKKKITVTFGKPLYPRDIFPNCDTADVSENKDDYRTAAAFVMQKIKEA